MDWQPSSDSVVYSHLTHRYLFLNLRDGSILYVLFQFTNESSILVKNMLTCLIPYFCGKLRPLVEFSFISTIFSLHEDILL